MCHTRTEFEVTCPCCQSTLVIDEGLSASCGTSSPNAPTSRSSTRRTGFSRTEGAPRRALRSGGRTRRRRAATRCRKRFEEALKQASQEPVTKPSRDFDLD